MAHGALMLVLLVLTAIPAWAQVEAYEGCADASGNPVAGVIDSTLGHLVETGFDDGRPAIRYNPRLLPNLPARARLFLFARECAHLALNHSPGARSEAQERQADCVAVSGLTQSGLIAGLPEAKEIEADLSLTADDWLKMPGRPRVFDLQACFGSRALKLPTGGTPSVRQAAWNACTRACADRLRSCQRGGTGEGHCLDSFHACETRCGEPDEAVTSSGPSVPGSGR